MTYNIYLFVLLACFITSILLPIHERGIVYLKWSIAVVFTAEAIAFYRAEILVINPFPIYHFLLPTEYALLAYFFRHYMRSKVMKHGMLISIGFYAGACIMLSALFYKSLYAFPSIQSLLSSILYCLLAANLLLNLEPLPGVSITRHPLAWICLGIIVFNTGSFFFTGVYNFLVEVKSKDRLLLHAILNNGLNCFMFLCFIIGIYFSNRLRKKVI